MKKIVCILGIFSLNYLSSIACKVCDRNQPKLLKGITHGTGPQGLWDYTIVYITIIISLFTLYYTIKWLIKPQENNKNHIKYSILK
ncbi:MAG: hypothetical protein QM539_00900 [Alphaproteobacteria bacterium]|nr:hypothetical protein [Alphaproteobacteria bacterium]